MIELLILLLLIKYRYAFYPEEDWVDKSLEPYAGLDSDYEYLKSVKSVKRVK